MRLPIQTLLKAVIGALSSVCKNEYECRLFGAAYCLAFFAFLRVGELVASNRIGAESVIMASDVIVNEDSDSLSLVIRQISMGKESVYGFVILVQKFVRCLVLGVSWSTVYA